jgi:hypothetical protein
MLIDVNTNVLYNCESVEFESTRIRLRLSAHESTTFVREWRCMYILVWLCYIAVKWQGLYRR